MPELATLEINGRVARLWLNRPEARNALSPDLLMALLERVDEIGRREDVSVVILAGRGQAFCAGMDLKAVTGPGAAGTGQRVLGLLAELTLRLRRLGAVTLARVHGAAIGGGCGLATVCDLALTHADARLGFPEVDMGVCPAVVAPWVVRKIGAGRARQILLSGGTMTGQQAGEMGLVDRVVPTLEATDPAVEEWAGRLAQGGMQALRATKALLNDLDGSLDESLMRRAAEISARVLATPEAQERLGAKLGSRTTGSPGG